MSVTELAGPKIPDSENGAVVYAGAFKLISGATAEKDLDILMRVIQPGRLATSPAIYSRAASVVRRYAGLFPLIEEAATRQKCAFPVHWELGLDAECPHLLSLRRLAWLVSASAILDGRGGRTTKAAGKVALIFAISESLKKEPSLIAQFDRISIIRTGLRTLRNGQWLEYLNDAEAKRLFDALAGIDLTPGFVSGMQGERATGIWVFDQVRSNGPAALGKNSDNSQRIHICPLCLCLNADERFYLDEMGRQVKYAGMTYHQAKVMDPRFDEDPHIPRYALISAMLLPVFPVVAPNRDKAVAEIGEGQIALALQAYRARFGTYPRNLAELREKLGWKLPKDPFSGNDLVYKRNGDGFLLYSIGPDLKDDGGREISRSRSGPENGDIVWRVAGSCAVGLRGGSQTKGDCSQ